MKRFIDAMVYPLVLLLAAIGLLSLGAGMTLGLALENNYIIKKPDEEVSDDK